MKLATMQSTQITSDVLEKRKIPCPAVSVDKLANESWRAMKHTTAKQHIRYHAAPTPWPREFNRMLDKGCVYPSPTCPCQLQGCLAWVWLQMRYKQIENGVAPHSAASWWSRLVPKHFLAAYEGIFRAFHLCIRSGHWGNFCVECVETAEKRWI